MTPPRAEFFDRLATEQDKRQKERCVKRKAGEQVWHQYQGEIHARQYRRYDRCKRP